MAIPTLLRKLATLPDLSAQDHPHYVSPGLGTGETVFCEFKPELQSMETRPEASEASPAKKVKREARGVETVLKQTAEIGMVLIGMAALRGGAPPTPVECHLAVEAYTNLEGLVKRVAPRDLLTKESLESLIQQFSLPQKTTLPLVSTPTPAQVVSTPTMETLAAPNIAKAASTPGKRSSTPLRTAASKPAVKRGASKSPTTRSKDSRSVSTTGIKEVVEKEPKLLPRVHQEIALAIRLSKPEVLIAALPETASAYINSPITCDTCKVLVNDTSSVLICDGCEAAFHLVCLQMHKHSDIPEKEWYCRKCVAVTGGRPRLPNYGHLRRGPGRPGSKTTWDLKSAYGDLSGKFSGKLNVSLRNRVRNTGAAQDGEIPNPA